jgi:alcohol dehydrogenase
LRIDELDLQPPGPGEVLVRIEAAGVCHSDLSVVDGVRPRPVPMLLGHEAAGQVIERGHGVDDLRVGGRVVLVFLPRCGDCAGCASDGRHPCVPGSKANAAGELLGGGRRLRAADGGLVHHHLGVSAFATHAVVDRRSVVPVSDDVPAEVAALLGCAVLTGGGAVVNAGSVQPGESVAVVGLGGVGLAAVLTAAAVGASAIIGVDPLPGKRSAAESLGATRTVHPDDVDFTADCVIEAAGSAAAVRTAIAAAGPGGRTVLAGLPRAGAQVSFSPLDLIAGGRSIVGSYLGSSVPSRDVPRFAELWATGRLPVERLVSGRTGLDGLNEALESLADGTALRQLIIPNQHPAQPS